MISEVNLTARRIVHSQLSILNLWQRHIVSVPKAPVYEDARPIFSQHQIGMSRQFRRVQSVAESPLPQPPAHNHLRLRILRVDCRHVLMSLFWREFIHKLMHQFFPSSKPRACSTASPPKSGYIGIVLRFTCIKGIYHIIIMP